MLSFMVHCWSFDGQDLEGMGLEPSEDMKNIIDNIHFWCALKKKKEIVSIKEAAKELFTLAVTDPNPSPRTNPILWWLAVLVQTQVIEHMPNLPIDADNQNPIPSLDINGHLEAINHYARVLILEMMVDSWKPADSQTSIFGSSSETKAHVITCVDDAMRNPSWVDQDEERPAMGIVHEDPLLADPAWQECLSYLQGLVQAWLIDDTRGPLYEILRLLSGKSPVARSNTVIEAVETTPAAPVKYKFEVMSEIWENFTRDGYSMSGLEGPASSGARSCGTYATVQKANAAARDSIVEEAGEMESAREWNETVRKDETFKISAVFIDDANNAKFRAWVEKRNE